MSAPRIVAKGQRLMAERIREIAREHNVPIIEDMPLARALFTRADRQRGPGPPLSGRRPDPRPRPPGPRRRRGPAARRARRPPPTRAPAHLVRRTAR